MREEADLQQTQLVRMLEANWLMPNKNELMTNGKKRKLIQKINKLAHIAFCCQLLKFQERVTFEIRKLNKRLMRL